MAKVVQVQLSDDDEAAIAALNVNFDGSVVEMLKNLQSTAYQKRQDARLRLFLTLSAADRKRTEDAIDAAIQSIVPTFTPGI